MHKQIVILMLTFMLAVNTCVCVSRPLVGGNLGLIDSTSRWPFFIDIVKQSGITGKGFGSYDLPYQSEGVLLDSDGWPIGSAGLMIYSGQGMIEGDYFIQVKGNVAFSLYEPFNALLMNFTFDSKTGLTTGIMRVGAQDGLLMIQFKNELNPTASIRDLKIIRPGYTVSQAEKQIYTKYTLSQLAKFPVLRFSDPTNAPFIYSDVIEWKDRIQPNTIFYTNYQGLPWELVIDLANVLKKGYLDYVPVSASDDYVTQLATLLKNSLPIDTIVYVEYSEKLWEETANGNQNYRYAINYVDKGNNIPLNYKADKFPNDDTIIQWIWAYRRIAFRSMQISNIFASVYGESNRNHLFRVVLSGEYDDPRSLMYGLQMVQDLYGNPSNFFYALSIMPIVSSPGDDFTNRYSNEQEILADMNTREESVVSNYNIPFVLSKMFDLKVCAFRGMIDTFAILDGKRNSEDTYAARKAFSQYSGLKQLVKAVLLNWFSYGFDYYMFHVITPVNFENPLPDRQYKYPGIGFTDNYASKSITEEAVEEVMTLSNINVSVPNVATIPSLLYPEIDQSFRSDQFFYVSPNYPIILSQMFFSVNCPKYAQYSVNLMAKATKSGSITFILNSRTIGTFSFSSLESYTLSNDLSFSMNQGYNILSLKINTGNAFDLKYLNVTYYENITPTNSPKRSISVRKSTQNSGSRIAWNISMYLINLFVLLLVLLP